jgi:hypothetical protein
MLRAVIWRKIVALSLALAVPASAAAGPLTEAAEKAGRELAATQQESSSRNRGRLWTSIALLAGGGVLAVLGGIELGDSDSGPDEDGDTDDAAGVDDSDTEEKIMLGGGFAAAGVGAILLMTGGRRSNPSVSAGPGRVTITHKVRF